MSGVTARLPDLGAAQDAAVNAQRGLETFLTTAGALAGGGSGSPLNAVTQALSGLDGVLQIDLGGLANDLPQALTTIQNALPADTLQYVEQIDGAYRSVVALLADDALLRQIQPGSSLEQTALALVDALIDQFGSRLAELGGSLVDADTLARVQQALASLQQIAGGQLPPAGELLQLVADQLLGVAPDLLASARTELDAALALVQPLSAVALQAQLGGVQAALLAAYQALAQAVRDFDAADAAAYAALEALLQAWSAALDAAFAALEAAYAALALVVAQPAWDTLFEVHAAALAAVPLPEAPGIDDAIDAMAGLLERLLTQLGMSLSPQDLAAQVGRVSQAVHAMFAQSPLPQVRQILLDFIARIDAALAAIPTESVQQAVTAMLGRVGQAVQALPMADIRGGIEDGFASAHAFIDERLGDTLPDAVDQALAAARTQLGNIPIADLGDALAGVVDAATTLVAELQTDLGAALDELRGVLAQLDSVSFQPVADEVIAEIDALRTKLAAIRPDALSDAERIALQAGLAVLRAIDLQGMIQGQLKIGYAGLSDELVAAVQRVLDAWLRFRGRLGNLDGAALAAPVIGLLDQATRQVQGVNGERLVAPLREQADALVARLQQLAPGALLTPLQAPYQRAMALVARADPDVWVQPLRSLHAEIDRLVALVDLTPLLDELEQRQRALYGVARQALVGALDALQLPPPLDAFLDTVKALVATLADALFGEPDTTLRQFSLHLTTSVRPSTLFQPLDQAFDRLLDALRAVPQADLLALLESLRSGLGSALAVLDPAAILRQLRAAQARVDSLAPAALPGVAGLPALRAQLEARLQAQVGLDGAKASLRLRLDLSLAPVDTTRDDARLRRVQAAHAALVAALRQRINGLDRSGAQAAYVRLDTGLGRLLPAFLRQDRPLTADDVWAGLATLRPSAKARRLDDAVARFVAGLQPLQSALDGAVDGFFDELRQAALMLHPGGLRDAVAGVNATLRDRLQVLDPDELAGELRATVWEPLMAPLEALNPQTLAQQLDGLHQALLARIGATLQAIIDRLRALIDAFLQQVREALSAVVDLLAQRIAGIAAGIAALAAQLDALVVDDLFGRLLTLLDNLRISFDQQLDRVGNEFDRMLQAIPLQSPSASLEVAFG